MPHGVHNVWMPFQKGNKYGHKFQKGTPYAYKKGFDPRRKHFTEGRRYGIQRGNKLTLGRKRPEEERQAIRLAKLGPKNPMWKGDNVGHDALHHWVKRHFPKPDFCELCSLSPPYDCANRSGRYLRDLNDWMWLCRHCHMKFDYANGQRIKTRTVPLPVL